MRFASFCLCLLVAACATVRPQDIEAWIGQPVAVLEKQPVFLSMQLVRTTASDGTEIRNYVKSQNIGSCSTSGSIFGGPVSFATYTSFTSCMQSVAACNNIFYIRDGRVQNVVIIGTGGASCYTDDRFRPGFSSSTNMF